MWAGQGKALSLHVDDQIRDPVDLFASHRAAFAGVRVQPGHGDAGLRNAELVAQATCGDFNGFA